jgi:hypothetical protein
MGTGSFQGINRPRLGVEHPRHLAQRLKKLKAIPLLPLLAILACSKFTLLDIIPRADRTDSKKRNYLSKTGK